MCFFGEKKLNLSGLAFHQQKWSCVFWIKNNLNQNGLAFHLPKCCVSYKKIIQIKTG
jgi:hypothetical protein